MAKDRIWIPDNEDGFIVGRIVDFAEDGPIVEPEDRRYSPKSALYDAVFPADENLEKDVEDNCGLMFLNEATLLNNIKVRYKKGKIYTYVANILIAVNPYCAIPDLYSDKTIREYMGKSLGALPPHVFAIADKAFRDMKVMKQSQSIIVSGESGAGKTESTKYILNYLCLNFGKSAGALERKILDANPILESFGNAKTTRNNNSSRFGKFIEIHFDPKCQVVGGYISHYLLERARVVGQNSQERNYHIFYQLCAGADNDLKKKLHLGSPSEFFYLSQGCMQYFLSEKSKASVPSDRISKQQVKEGPLKDGIIDDFLGFTTLDRDLENIGMDKEQRLHVYTTIAAVLHIGNISFEDDPDDQRGGCRISNKSEKSLDITGKLLGLDPGELNRALTARVMQATKGGYKGTVIMVPLKVQEAKNARDALAKTLYSNLFDFIVKKINESIPFNASSHYIGVLDIAGFEYFAVNSFEQFCINYCNEKLQQFFNQRILKDEQELYEREGLGVKNVMFVDNQDCIELIESKNNGILCILDEESKLPKPNSQHFTTECHAKNKNHFRLDLARKSKLKEHREIRDEDGFLIRHFAGAVCYQTSQFIEKNNDALHASLEALVQECKNIFVKNLFKNGSESSKNRGRLNYASVGGKFKSQLAELMDKLSKTGTNFIRCIKPNVKMVSKLFEGGSILSQLQCAGMTSVLQLMQEGYPSRTQFSELYNMYKQYLPGDLARLDPRMFCKALFKALGLNDRDFKFGMTKVFFRPGKFSEFDQLMKGDSENLKLLISKVRKWLVRNRWRRIQWAALSVIKLKKKIEYRRNALIVIQKTTRMFLAKKRNGPRIKALMNVKALTGQVQQIFAMAKNLKTEKEIAMMSAENLQKAVDKAAREIRENSKLQKRDLDKLYQDLVKKIDQEISEVNKKVKKQKAEEEERKLRKIQEEMNRKKRQKEEEEARLLKIEEDRKLKIKMEAKRKEDVEKRKKEEEKNQEHERKLQKDIEDAHQRIIEQVEQERRDHELAVRIAAETGGLVEEVQLKRSNLVTARREAAANKKYDLSKWKYAELRDTINTSCDIELLEACREEFHRRLKVYHAWKAKNRKNNSTFDESRRAPISILQEANKNAGGVSKKSSTSQKTQRFFRIPFVRQQKENETANQQSSKGWWYAHFDGDWIARQIESHPGRKPILLVAGKDDMQMCELSLDETGLTRKRGAEILAEEFESEWSKFQGPTYKRASN